LKGFHQVPRYFIVTWLLPGIGAHAETYDRENSSSMETCRLNEKELRWPILSIENSDVPSQE
jgi:hypothetical protein